MGAVKDALSAVPLFVRWFALGAIFFGIVGAIVGLVVGLNVYAPTAWAAAFYIGIPAALVGAVLGFAVGGLATAWRDYRGGSDVW